VWYISAHGLKVFISGEKQNPHFFEEVAQHPPHVMMWAGVTSSVFDVSVAGESYLKLLFHWIIPQLDNVGVLNRAILQQDGAPTCYAG
jgi:hypothetical protein